MRSLAAVEITFSGLLAGGCTALHFELFSADRREGDGIAALGFTQAQEQARAWFASDARAVKGIAAAAVDPYTVGAALDDYLATREREGKSSAGDTRHRAGLHFRPALGDIELRTLTAGRLRNLLNGLAASPAQWRAAKGKAPMLRPRADAGEAKHTRPRVSFHTLRHTYASLAVMNRAPVNLVAHNLGYSDTRMVEKYYGHLAPSYIAERIREAAPRFGIAGAGVVTPLRRI